MGKKTLYHPVSLNVIRGAAEYCGFQLGKLKQLSVDREVGVAVYQTELLCVPADAADSSNDKLRERLNGCFVADVDVENVWNTKTGRTLCQLRSRIAWREGSTS